MGFLDENVTTPPNRKPPVDRDKIAALPKMYNPKGLVDYIKDKREDLRGDTNLTADSLSATYRPDAVTLRMSRGNNELCLRCYGLRTPLKLSLRHTLSRYLRVLVRSLSYLSFLLP